MKYLPGYLLLLLSWLQPSHVLPWVSWHSEVLAFMAVAWFFVVQLDVERRKGGGLTLPSLACAPLVLGLYALLQFAIGQIVFFGDALMIALYMAACSMAIMVGYQWKAAPALRQDERLAQLAMTLLAGALLSIGIMFVQSTEVWNTVDWIVRTEGYRRPGGNVGQPNHIATLILMGVASLAWLHQVGRLGAGASVVMQVLLIVGLAMTESRAGLLSGVALTGWWLLRRRLFTKLPIHVVACFWAGLLFMVWAWPVFITNWHYVGTGVDTVNRISTGVGVRSVVWAQLLDAALQRPWAGWGLREVSQAHNAVLHAYGESAPFSYAHNVLLDLVLGVGFPLALLLVGLSIWWFLRRMKATVTPDGWYGLALAIPLVVHSMLEFPYAYAYFLVPVFLALGFVEGGVARVAVLRVRWIPASIGAGVIFTLLVWSGIEYVAIEEDFGVARFEALRVGQTPQDYVRPKAKLLTQLDAVIKATRIRPGVEMPATDLELLRHAAGRFPWTAIQHRYALSLALNGSPEEAIRQMQVMRAMHGEAHYKLLKENWVLMGQEQYPQIKDLKLP